MTTLASSAALVVAAYFLGSIPFGLLLARARGIDIRALGSHNIGATNVARNLGKKTGLVVLILDAAKGAAPVWIASRLSALGAVDAFAITAVGAAAAIGHCFPVWLRFRGGKGVATSLGIMLTLAPLQAAMVVCLFVAIYALFRVASLGSLATSLLFGPLLWWFDYPAPDIALAAVLAVLIWVQHRGNIIRLVRGQENKV